MPRGVTFKIHVINNAEGYYKLIDSGVNNAEGYYKSIDSVLIMPRGDINLQIVNNAG